jgi:hypothetical protein
MDDAKDGKDNKSIFEKIADAFNNVVDTASAAATKATGPDDPEKVAGKSNEQLLVGDAAIAPEAVPPVEKNLNPRPMTADEIAHHAAADTQPIVAAKKTPSKKAVMPRLSGRITPTYDFPVPDTPMPSPKKPKAVKKAKKSAKKSAKAAKKSSKKAVKKSKAKKSVRTSPKKSKKAAKTTAKKSSKKSKKSKR